MTRMGWQVCERLGGRDRGWRVELLVEQLTSKLEQKFLLCCYCSGLMRDACLLEKEGKQEVRCYVCIPEGVTWKPALMNRETNHQRENYSVSIEGEGVRLDRLGEQRGTAPEGVRVPSCPVSAGVCEVGGREERGAGASGEETGGRAREGVLSSEGTEV